MVLGDVLIIRKCILKHLGVKCQGLLIMQIDKYPFLKSVMGIELFTALLNVSVSLKIIIRNQILKPPGAEPLWKEPLRLISYMDLGCSPAPPCTYHPSAVHTPFSWEAGTAVPVFLLCWPLASSRPAKAQTPFLPKAACPLG